MTRRTILIGSLTVAFAVACRDSPTSTQAPGLLTLITVDGTALPAPGPTTITVRGSLELRGNGHFTLLQSDSAIANAAVTQFNATGTWALSDNAVVLSGGPELYLGVIGGLVDTVRLNFGPHVNLYVRK